MRLTHRIWRTGVAAGLSFGSLDLPYGITDGVSGDDSMTTILRQLCQSCQSAPILCSAFVSVKPFAASEQMSWD